MFQHGVPDTIGYRGASAPALGFYTPCFNTGFLTQLTTEAHAPLGLLLPRHGVVATCVRNPNLKIRVCRGSFPGVPVAICVSYRMLKQSGVLCQGSIGNGVVATCVRNPGLKTRVCQGSIGNNAILLMLKFQILLTALLLSCILDP